MLGVSKCTEAILYYQYHMLTEPTPAIICTFSRTPIQELLVMDVSNILPPMPLPRQFVPRGPSPGRAALPRGRSDTALGQLVDTSTAVKKTDERMHSHTEIKNTRTRKNSPASHAF